MRRFKQVDWSSSERNDVSKTPSHIFFSFSNESTGFLQICADELSCPARSPQVCPDGKSPTSDFLYIAIMAVALFLLSSLSSIWLFHQGNYSNVFYFSKVVCCGRPIIHPMLLNDAIMLSCHPPFEEIFETATSKKPKLFLSVDRISGKNSLEVAATDRASFSNRPWFQTVLDFQDKRDHSDQMWTIQPLHLCIQKGWIASFAALMFLGADWNAANEAGTTASDELVNFLQQDVEQSFCETNIFVKRWLVRDEGWLELFEKALKLDFDNCLDTLVSMKSTVSEKVCNSSGNTALHLACEANKTGLVEALTKRMQNTSIQNFEGQTPLHLAVQMKNPETVKLLIGPSTDVNLQDKKGRTAVFDSVLLACIECLKLLVESGADINVSNHLNQTPLHLAARIGALDCAKFLIENGAMIDAKDKRGNTALHCACHNVHFDEPNLWTLRTAKLKNISEKKAEIGKLLIEAGVDVNARNVEDRTPLHIASERSQVRLMELLLENGCDPDAQDLGGSAAVHILPMEEHFDCLKILVEGGANVNLKDRKLKTSLHHAAGNCCVESVRYLVDHGAVVDAKDSLGRTPLQWSMLDSAIDVTKVLLKAKADINTSEEDQRTLLHTATSKYSPQQVEFLLENGADKNAKDIKNKTPCYLAVEYNSVECLEVLIKRGADLSIRDTLGMSPLHVAAGFGLLKCLELLLEAGADINARDSAGNTPLLSNLTSKRENFVSTSNDSVECCRRLVRAGADISAKNDLGQAPASFERVKRVKKELLK